MRILTDLRQALPYDVIQITDSNYTIAREVYATNPAYFQLFDEATADDDSILSAINAVPDGFDIAGKLFAALCRDGDTVAVLDLLSGYPSKDDLWLGLLLVHGNMHGKGIGAVITNSVVKAARLAGFESICLGVMEANAGAIHFWQKAGFVHERTSGDILIFKRSVHESI